MNIKPTTPGATHPPENHSTPKSIERNELKSLKKVEVEHSMVEKSDHEASGDNAKERGVIRHLQEGHFKGVADVRLRIVFQAELKATAQEKTANLLTKTASDLTAKIAAELDGLAKLEQFSVDQVEAIDDLRKQFEINVDSLASEFVDVESRLEKLQVIASAFLTDLQTHFERFESYAAESERVSDSLETAVPSPSRSDEIETVTSEAVPETGVGNVGTEPTTDVEIDAVAQPMVDSEVESAGFDFNALLVQIRNRIDEQLATFELESQEFKLAAPTRPYGNGVAFEKFLSILRSIQNSDVDQLVFADEGTATADDSQNNEVVDIIA